MPFTTVLVPEWDNAATANQARQNLGDSYKSFRKYPLHFSGVDSCWAIELNERAETMPPGLLNVPMRAIRLIATNLVNISAQVGRYKELNMTGRVQAYGGYEMTVFDVTVTATCTDGLTIEEVNDWFDELLTGRGKRPTTHRVAPNSSRSDINTVLGGF